MEYWVVGVISSRRIKSWSETIHKYNQKLKIFSYKEFIESVSLEVNECVTLRIESPSEDFETEKFLLQQGLYASLVSSQEINQLKFDKGIIRFAKQWFKGWQITLRQIQEKAGSFENIKFMNSPSSIALMFNKLACQEHLASNNIRTPTNYGKVLSYEHLKSLLKKHHQYRLFIKPNHGSSASGVMAYQCNSSGREAIISSIELDSRSGIPKLYNNLRIRKYENKHEIETIIDLMAVNDLYCEAWIPKKSINGLISDVRVLVINNRACHLVLRKSKNTITNTHLGNIKADIFEATSVWGTDLVNKIKNAAERAAKSFPDSFYCGVDIALSSSNKVYVLEVNAFGDLLLDNYHNNLNTYDYEFQEWQKKLT